MIEQAAQGLGRNLTMTVAGVLTVMVALLLLGAALVVRSATNEIRNELVNQLNVSVYLDPNITQTEQQAISKSLTDLPQVKSITYLSQTRAYQIFLKTDPTVAKVTKPSEIPPSFVVRLYNPKNFPVVFSAMGCSAETNSCTTPGVLNVSDVQSVINRVLRLLHGITLGALVVSIAMLVIAGLLIYNAMQVSAFSRRRETGIMRLVGASDLSIQAPFVVEGVTIGLVGSLLAFGLLMASRVWVEHNVAIGALAPFGAVSHYLGTLPYVLIVGIGLSGVLSFLTLQRHLRV